jgi:plastocyanin domain-containing protein
MRTSTLALLSLAIISCTKAPAPNAPPPAPQVVKVTPRAVALRVTAEGFEPASVTLKAGEPVKFVVTRTTDETCATDLLIDGTDIKLALPLNAPVEAAWTPSKAGKVKFGCAMDFMVGGVLVVE